MQQMEQCSLFSNLIGDMFNNKNECMRMHLRSDSLYIHIFFANKQSCDQHKFLNRNNTIATHPKSWQINLHVLNLLLVIRPYIQIHMHAHYKQHMHALTPYKSTLLMACYYERSPVSITDTLQGLVRD